MTVLLSKILSSVIHPLNFAIYGLIFAGLLRLVRFRKLASVAGVVSVAWLTFWSTPIFVERTLMAWEQQYAPTLPELAADADIIVVLGGGLQGASKPERPTPDLGEAADRMWAGAKLYNAGKAPKVLLTGGSQPWNGLTTSEADGMADLMISFGVAKGDLILEDQSQNTYENAVLSEPFLTKLEVQSALLVTSAFHMQRSIAVFEKAMPGIQWIPYGTDIQTVQRAPSVIEWLPAVGTLRQSQAYLRERVGIWVYGWRDYL